jgi:nicotinic acid phosphoribosyltransferase
MAYAYWKSGKIDDQSVFDLYFRNNPFHGEFTIFAGLEECLKFMENFRYSDEGKNSSFVDSLFDLNLCFGFFRYSLFASHVTGRD